MQDSVHNASATQPTNTMNEPPMLTRTGLETELPYSYDHEVAVTVEALP